MNVRTATSDDREVVLELVAEFHEFAGYSFDAFVQRAVEELAARHRWSVILLADQNDQSVGYGAVCYGFSVEFGGRDAFVDELYVRPSARGRGVGRALLEEMIGHCRAQGIRAVHLEVDDGNDRAAALYERVGFERQASAIMTLELD